MKCPGSLQIRHTYPSGGVAGPPSCLGRLLLANVPSCRRINGGNVKLNVARAAYRSTFVSAQVWVYRRSLWITQQIGRCHLFHRHNVHGIEPLRPMRCSLLFTQTYPVLRAKVTQCDEACTMPVLVAIRFSLPEQLLAHREVIPRMQLLHNVPEWNTKADFTLPESHFPRRRAIRHVRWPGGS